MEKQPKTQLESHILPEIENKFSPSVGKPFPSFYDEQAWLDRESKKVSGLGDAGVLNMSGSNKKAFRDSFFNLQELKARHYVKNLDYLRKNPDNKDFQELFMYGVRKNRFIPLNNLLSLESEANRATSIRGYKIENNLVDENSSTPLSQVDFDYKKFPTDLTVDSQGNYNFKYEELSPNNTKFFQDQQTMFKTLSPFMYLYEEPYKLSLKDLIKSWNSLQDSDDKKFDEEQDFTEKFFEHWAQVQLARIEPDEDKAAFKAPHSKTYTYKHHSNNDERGLNLDLSAFNLWNTYTEPTAVEQSKEDFDESVKYWRDKGFRTPSLSGLKRELADALAAKRWEKMPEGDKKFIKQTLGSLSVLYPDKIQTDSEGLGSMMHPTEGWEGYLDPEVYRVLLDFEKNQNSLFGNDFPKDWNSDVLNEGEGQDFFQAQLDKQSRAINLTMQRMMQTGALDRVGTGVEITTDAQLEAAKRELDTVFATASLIEGLGMESASQEEMNHLVDLISQYLELSNQAAIRGEAFKSFADRSKNTYTENGRTYRYDFRQRFKKTEISGDAWKEVGGLEVDPVYKLVTDFIKDAENYVVMAGNDGKKIVPFIEWLGLSSKKSEDSSLPLRVKSLRLSGTDVISERKLAKLRSGLFFKTPLETWGIEGSSGDKGEKTKVIDLGESAEVLKSDTKDVLKKRDTLK